jgi:hypothetical protein
MLYGFRHLSHQTVTSEYSTRSVQSIRQEYSYCCCAGLRVVILRW